MMNYKSTLIKKYGTDVEVDRYSDGVSISTVSTKALLGRGSKSNSNMYDLESQKEGIFLPEFDIDSGDFVINNNHNEKYVVVGTHNEYVGNSSISIITNLLKCSHKVTIKGQTKVTDGRGNLKTTFGDKYKDIPCYLQEVTNTLRQYDAGINPDTEYRIFTTALSVEDVDQVIINLFSKEVTFKVISKDYITFPNMVILEVNRDIRK